MGLAASGSVSLCRWFATHVDVGASQRTRRLATRGRICAAPSVGRRSRAQLAFKSSMPFPVDSSSCRRALTTPGVYSLGHQCRSSLSESVQVRLVGWITLYSQLTPHSREEGTIAHCARKRSAYVDVNERIVNY